MFVVNLAYSSGDIPSKPSGPPVCLSRKDHPQTASGWHADHVISRLLLGQGSEFFFGVERVEFGPDRKSVFTNDVPGQFMHEPRLYLGCFGPDKLRRIRL